MQLDGQAREGAPPHARWTASDEPGAEPLNAATKYVASTTLRDLEWQNSRLIEGDVPTAIRALKAQDGPELQVHGSADLLQTLIEHGLVDEFRLWIFPLVLGSGSFVPESPSEAELERRATQER